MTDLLDRPASSSPGSVDVERRIISGTVVPYGVETKFTNIGREVMHPRCFWSSLRHGRAVPLLVEHDGAALIGRSVRFRETRGGLVGEFKLKNGPLADEALEDAATGLRAFFSVGFFALNQKRLDGVNHLLEAELMHVALTHSPAYRGAQVLTVKRHVGDVVERRGLRVVNDAIGVANLMMVTRPKWLDEFAEESELRR